METITTSPVSVLLPNITVSVGAPSGTSTDTVMFGGDDELPENTASQIEQIVGRMEREHANLTYTDWIEKTTNSSVVRRPGPYNWAKHITSPVWMHQLVVMRTSAAQELAKRLPQGLYWTEFLLYAPLAQKNPIYWPEVGYIWHKGETGMHCHEHIAKAQQNSVLWYLQKGRT